ncbi:hypothetical protein [Paenibacillus eucommiae]|uniref:Uncharacterized protein n=1 Tax=Paenibacillus eucommiae TaxID=1355755 RepID=A0ABS4ITT5_9BACL|nr:hypothetical protein [Paenibacillus eucommiae]MBP1990997.1 hypothetical protein [Paenibacillus eucommiae]
MNRSAGLIRISQLPVALFGIVHVKFVDGIRLFILAYTNLKSYNATRNSPPLT